MSKQRTSAKRLKGKELAFIRSQRVARLASVDEAGEPHNVPVCVVALHGHLYFATDADTRKVKNLRANPRAALVFDRYEEDWNQLAGVLVIGATSIIEKGTAFHRVRLALYRKYRQYRTFAPIESGKSVIVCLTPEKTFSWGL